MEGSSKPRYDAVSAAIPWQHPHSISGADRGAATASSWAACDSQLRQPPREL